VVAAAASKAFYIDNAVLSLPLSDRSGPAFSQRRPPHTVISNEAGRFFFFRVRSCERVGLRREKSLFSFLFFSFLFFSFLLFSSLFFRLDRSPGNANLPIGVGFP